MKKLLSLALSLLLACSLCTALAADYSDVFTNFDLRDSWTAATEITFTDTAVTINGSGAAARRHGGHHHRPGVYKLQGSCADGQVLVEIDKAEKAQLVLAGLTLTCRAPRPCTCSRLTRCPSPWPPTPSTPLPTARPTPPPLKSSPTPASAPATTW